MATRENAGSPDHDSTDRRVRRSRRALHAALVALCAERGYDTVTVDDLTSHADMARRTFYAHYDDKDDLLRSVVSELVDDLVERVNAVMPQDLRKAEGAVIQEMFAHGQDNTDAYRMVLAGAANGTGLRMVSNRVADVVTATLTRQCELLGVKPRLPVDFIARAFVGQYLTLLRWWLDNQNDYTLEEMASMRFQMFVRGEVWALGFDADTVAYVPLS